MTHVLIDSKRQNSAQEKKTATNGQKNLTKQKIADTNRGESTATIKNNNLHSKSLIIAFHPLHFHFIQTLKSHLPNFRCI